MKKTLVIVVMGSQSDFPVMKMASEFLKKWKISCETLVVSAHRTPQLLEKSVKEWEKSGVRVIIAGAGGAAHLPGMLASFSILPVIGVPVKTRTLSGIDSLLSIAQMPPGVPVATVGIDGAKNAALLALKILAVGNDALSNKVLKKLHQHKNTLYKDVVKMRSKVKKLSRKL